MNGIVWMVRVGAKWADLPEQYLPYQTCHRRFQRWVRDGAFERLFAWFGDFPRRVVCYERQALNCLGFVHLGCILTLLRQGL